MYSSVLLFFQNSSYKTISECVQPKKANQKGVTGYYRWNYNRYRAKPMIFNLSTFDDFNITYSYSVHFEVIIISVLFIVHTLTHSLREPGGRCTKSMEVSESRMERVKA